MTPPHEIDSQRALLRKSSVVDAEDIFANYARDEVVTQFLPWDPHADLHATRRFLQKCNEHWRDGKDFSFGIVLKEKSSVVGMISMRPKNHNVDMGFVLARTYWGQGLTTEALTALIDWCLAQPQYWRVEAYCDVENAASARTMEKAGMTREGLLRNYLAYPSRGSQPKDAYLYARVRNA